MGDFTRRLLDGEGATAHPPPAGVSGAAAPLPTLRERLAVFARHNATLLRNWRFMLLCVAAGITSGMASDWGSTISLEAPSLVSTVAAGWIGFGQGAGGTLVAVAAGALVDRFRWHKGVIVWSCLLFAGCVAWFACLIEGRITGPSVVGNLGRAQAYISATLAVVVANAAWPIFFDISVEESYPVPEAVSLNMLMAVYNVGSLALLAVPLDTAARGYNWSCVVVATVFAVALAVGYRSSERRIAVDRGDEGACEEAEAAGAAAVVVPSAGTV